MPVFVCDYHFLYDLFNVLIRGFNNTIHLRPVRGRIVMLDLEFLAQGSDHSIIQICTIACNDPLWDTVTTYEILLDEPGNNILGDGRERGFLNPLCKIINGH